MKEGEDCGFGEDWEYVEDFGDVSDDEGGDHAPEEEECHGDDAGQALQSSLQQDSPASLSLPHDSTNNIDSIASSSTSSSASSDSSSSNDFQTANSSSSPIASGSNAEDQVVAASSDIPARPTQQNMSSAADAGTSTSDMQTDMQPGLPVCAESPSALQPDATPVREGEQAHVLYPDDPACWSQHVDDTPSAQMDQDAAAAHARYASGMLL